VAPGLNNDNSLGDAELTAAHGAAWADMTTALIDYIGAKKYQDVYIGAAIDAEPGYSDYGPVATWVTNFTSHSGLPLYNFGSTDQYPCPTTFPAPEACSSWTTDQFYQISWAIPGTFAMPQIYKPIHARWWYIIKRRAFDNHSDYMTLLGSWCCSTQVGQTEQAWRLLWLELNADPITQQDLYWVTANRQQ